MGADGPRFPAVSFTEPVDPAGVLSAAAKGADRRSAVPAVRGDAGRPWCVRRLIVGQGLFAVVPVSLTVDADRYPTGLTTHTFEIKDPRDADELVCGAR